MIGECQFGVNSEYMPLKAIVLGYPPDSIAGVADPREALFLQAVNLDKMRLQFEELVRCYQNYGIHVYRYHSEEVSSPNAIFLRDTFAMTPEGFVRARMGVKQRLGEGSAISNYLLKLGVNSVFETSESLTFEGADLLWLNSKTLLVGVGKRTSVEFVESVRTAFKAYGVTVESISVAGASQHLLGTMQIVDSDKVIVRRERCSEGLELLLKSYGYNVIYVDLGDRPEDGWIANSVTIAPSKVISPGGNPKYFSFLRKHGVEVIPVDVTEYIHAAGGVGCATGILSRDLI